MFTAIRLFVVSAVSALALGGTANAQPQPPVFVTSVIQKQKVNSTTYRARLQVTVRVTGVLSNTLTTDWVTLKKVSPPVICPPRVVGGIRLSASFVWTGSVIRATGSVRITAGPLNVTRSLSIQVAAN